jgi:hypothetical protein
MHERDRDAEGSGQCPRVCLGLVGGGKGRRASARKASIASEDRASAAAW